jgi:hypothetical protein
MDVHGQPTKTRELWSLIPAKLGGCQTHNKDHGKTAAIVLLTLGSVLLATVVVAGIYFWYRKHRLPRQDYQPVY